MGTIHHAGLPPSGVRCGKTNAVQAPAKVHEQLTRNIPRVTAPSIGRNATTTERIVEVYDGAANARDSVHVMFAADADSQKFP